MDDTTITHLAHLARLTVPQEELTAVAKDVGAILGFIDQVQGATVAGAGTTIAQNDSVQAGTTSKGDTNKHGVAMQNGIVINVSREDVTAPILPVHDLVECAPLHRDHFVQVPKVLE